MTTRLFLSSLIFRLRVRLFARWRWYPDDSGHGRYTLALGRKGAPLVRLYSAGRVDWCIPSDPEWHTLGSLHYLRSFVCPHCVARAKTEAKVRYLCLLRLTPPQPFCLTPLP